MKESWVKAMELRLVRAELDKCHKGEGVNHYENCGWLAEKVLQMMRENRVCCFYISSACVYYFWLTLICRSRDTRSSTYKILSLYSGRSVFDPFK